MTDCHLIDIDAVSVQPGANNSNSVKPAQGQDLAELELAPTPTIFAEELVAQSPEDAPTEPPKAVKELPKELPKEPPKEPPKELPKEVKEPPKEPTKEPTKEVKELPKDVKELPKDVKELPKEHAPRVDAPDAPDLESVLLTKGVVEVHAELHKMCIGSIAKNDQQVFAVCCADRDDTCPAEFNEKSCVSLFTLPTPIIKGVTLKRF